jgi:hypothetical protein
MLFPSTRAFNDGRPVLCGLGDLALDSTSRQLQFSFESSTISRRIEPRLQAR